MSMAIISLLYIFFMPHLVTIWFCENRNRTPVMEVFFFEFLLALFFLKVRTVLIFKISPEANAPLLERNTPLLSPENNECLLTHFHPLNPP